MVGEWKKEERKDEGASARSLRGSGGGARAPGKKGAKGDEGKQAPPKKGGRGETFACFCLSIAV